MLKSFLRALLEEIKSGVPLGRGGTPKIQLETTEERHMKGPGQGQLGVELHPCSTGDLSRVLYPSFFAE